MKLFPLERRVSFTIIYYILLEITLASFESIEIWDTIVKRNDMTLCLYTRRRIYYNIIEYLTKKI